MLAPLSLTQISLVTVGAWALWRFLRVFVVKSHIDNIPGPKSASFLTGNFRQLLNRQGWKFLDELERDYQSVVKFHGLFGSKLLFVFDPKALHSIIVKDQYSYDAPRWFTASTNLMFGPGLLGTYG